VQPALAAAVAALLRPGGRLLLQSDVLEVAEDMRERFEEAAGGLLAPAPEHAAPGGVFHAASPPEGAEEGAEPAAPIGWAAVGWLVENPLGVPTEREVHVLAQGLPV
jgi:tRNA (guanine-N7-)-methyltransferase